ncbi:MAG: TIGR03067 domain-containing protein [Rariglobus sp.]
MSTTTLDGTWLPVRAELDGDLAPALALERMQLVLAADAYTVSFAGAVHDSGSFIHTTDTLTLTAKKGEHAGRVVPAIYQLAGNRLRICYALDGVAPTEFATSPHSQRYLVTYRRQST